MHFSSQLPIALDAMGGDNAPFGIVRGAVAFALEADHPVLLVGLRTAIDDAVRHVFSDHHIASGDRERVARLLTIVEAAEVIGMDEHPASAVRSKGQSSLVRTCTLVADRRAGAAVSAGNSGAMLAAAMLTMRRIGGVGRPAIGTVVPTRGGRMFLIDAGANTDCKPEWLAQFAVMGNVFAKRMLGIANPRVGLLSNGEEPGKGSHLVHAARPLIEALPIRFIGNIEGRDLFNGTCDVAVTDGFTGNVVLKAAEGVGEYLFAEIRTRASAGVRARIGGVLLRGSLRPLRDQADYRHTGGALLLGVRGEAVIAHGRSDALAITNALRVARRAMDNDVSGTITAQLATAGAPGAPIGTDTKEQPA